MTRLSLALLLVPLLGACATAPAGAPRSELPGLYYRMLEAATGGLEARLETEGVQKHTGATLAGALLYASPHPGNPCRGDRRRLALALKAGDLLAAESEAGRMTWLNHRWLLAPWIDTVRLLDRDLGDERRASWRREIGRQLQDLAVDVAEREHAPRYASPYIRTSPNHLSIWASALHAGGRLLGNRDWEELGARVMRRFAVEEQTPDGFWGEHSRAGPTTGYNYLTASSVAYYREQSGDPAALAALRRALDFHLRFTWPDGTPVEVVNDRNRHGGVSAWGHFGFSNFPDGRRYAEFLTGFLRDSRLQGESLARIAQNALYFHEGPSAPIPQDLERWVHRMEVPAGMRRRGPWWACLSGIIATPAPRNQFYLDRQGNLSVHHAKTGLIVNGANSKRQPELGTFSETFQGQTNALPLSSRLEMGGAADRLSLSYNSFWATLELQPRSERTLDVTVRVTEMGRIEQAQMALQLVLKPGETLETGSAKVVLGPDRIDLDPAGVLRHRGWTLKCDPAARFVWPVFPFNPYANGPETNLERAVGLLSIPLRPKPGSGRLRTQELRFELEVQ